MSAGPDVILPIEPVEDWNWRDDAVCTQVDPTLFFVKPGGSTRAAKSVCVVCPVREECLEWALESREPFGVWGGLSERERNRLLRLSA